MAGSTTSRGLLAVAVIAGLSVGCGSGRKTASTETRAGAGRSVAAREHEAVARVREVAYEFFRPAKAGDGRRACARLTSAERARLDRVGGCEAVIGRYGSRFITGREVVVVGIHVDPRSGRASASVVRSAVKGRPPVIELSFVGGVWRVSDIDAAARRR